MDRVQSVRLRAKATAVSAIATVSACSTSSRSTRCGTGRLDGPTASCARGRHTRRHAWIASAREFLVESELGPELRRYPEDDDELWADALKCLILNVHHPQYVVKLLKDSRERIDAAGRVVVCNHRSMIEPLRWVPSFPNIRLLSRSMDINWATDLRTM